MEKYKCHICNKKHAVYYSSTGAIPKSILNIRANAEMNRIKELEEFLHIVDNKDVFLKGVITIETTFTDYPISHEAWIEVPIKKYTEQVDQAKGNPSLELYGKIASDLPFYQNLIGLDAKWILDSENQTGEIVVQTESKLKEDQNNPITELRIEKMMELIHHPEIIIEKTTFEHSFQERMKRIIDQAKYEFTDKSKLFLIDISNAKEVLFQLVPSEMTSIERSGDIGIHLSNDESNGNYDLVSKRMSKLNAVQMFQKLTLDEIETYQKNYKYHEEDLFKDVKHIIEFVYEENIEEFQIVINAM